MAAPTPAPRPHWLELAGTANTRDLGGLPAAGGLIRDHVLLRSDNLQGLTAADVHELVEVIGLRTVVDLRTDSERRKEGPGPLAAVPSVRILPLSVIVEDAQIEADPGSVLPGRDGVEVPARWADGPTGAYLHYLTDRPESFAAAVRSLAAPGAGATLVHCAAGKDRTGVLVALLLSLGGVPDEVIAADYAATNERVEAIVARLAGSQTYRADVLRIGVERHRVDPDTMIKVLGWLAETHGGAAGYLRVAGVYEAELAVVRDRLVQRG